MVTRREPVKFEGCNEVKELITPSERKQVKSFNTACVVNQMSTRMLKYAIYAFSVEKQLKSVLNI